MVAQPRSDIDLSNFYDPVVLGDGLINVREESGAVVKVMGSSIANRNPAATRLKPMNSLQLSRVIQRAAKQQLDYAVLHPHERHCSACDTFHHRSRFGKEGQDKKNDGLNLSCIDSINRYQRDRYAAEQIAKGRAYTPQPNKRKPHKKKKRNR